MINKKTKTLGIILGIVVALFISAIIIVPIITNLLTPTVNITNLASLSNELNNSKNSLGQNLFRILKANNYVNNRNIEGTIRENTFKKTLYSESTNWSFILDMDEIKLTYLISYSTPNGNEQISEPLFVSCPTKDESKYPETKCIGSYDSGTTLESYLPLKGKTTDGYSYSVYSASENDQPQIRIYAESCGIEKINESIKATVLGWISENGFNPDDYTILTYEICDNSYIYDLNF